MEVNERCLAPVQFVTYKDKIWCDAVTWFLVGLVYLIWT